MREMTPEEPERGTSPTEPPPLEPATQNLWAEYALARFASAEDRIKEFRNTARQLGAAVAVIIGLELTLIAKILDAKPGASDVWPVLALGALFSAVAIQTALLFQIFSLGYATRELMGPEGPKQMRFLLAGKDERYAREVIARYYANACDGAEKEGGLYALAESLGKRLRGLSRSAAWSVTLLVVGVFIWAGSILLTPHSASYTSPVMAQQPKPPQPPPPPRPVAPPAPPTVAPVLPTPTRGIPLNEGAEKKKP